MAETVYGEAAAKLAQGGANLLKGLLKIIIALIVLVMLCAGGIFWAYRYGITVGEKLGRAEAACEAKSATLKDNECIKTTVITP